MAARSIWLFRSKLRTRLLIALPINQLPSYAWQTGGITDPGTVLSHKPLCFLRIEPARNEREIDHGHAGGGKEPAFIEGPTRQVFKLSGCLYRQNASSLILELCLKVSHRCGVPKEPFHESSKCYAKVPNFM